MRAGMKKPLGARAQRLALEKLAALAPGNNALQRAILDQSTFHCWQGLFALSAPGGRAGLQNMGRGAAGGYAPGAGHSAAGGHAPGAGHGAAGGPHGPDSLDTGDTGGPVFMDSLDTLAIRHAAMRRENPEWYKNSALPTRAGGTRAAEGTKSTEGTGKKKGGQP